MNGGRKNPRVLIVTPEVTYLPDRMGSYAQYLTAKAGGLADVSAALISALFNQGADVHVALPDYRAIFKDRLAPFLQKEYRKLRQTVPDSRLHLAEDRVFYYLNRVYSAYYLENTKLSLAFQREVINNIIPRVQPDLIHCNDWMTGLIPSYARKLGIPCLFTIHNIHSVKATMAHIEDRGIDAAEFWQHLFFDQYADCYEYARESIPVDFLTSGVFAGHFVNTVSPRFLVEIVEGYHHFVPDKLRQELINKYYAGCAYGILNAPDPAFNPRTDSKLPLQYDAASHVEGKRFNKRHVQQQLGLLVDPKAPLLFWPSRLDPVQKGCQLLADIIYHLISDYWQQRLQMVFVADGEYQRVFRDIVHFHGFQERVAVCDFNNALEHQCYAASDFVLMPSSFEPCGLPQMIGPIYGSLPIAHDTGGIHDTITDLNTRKNRGNGFLFKYYNPESLRWAVDQAMRFYKRSVDTKAKQIHRVMEEAITSYNHANTAKQYIDLYEKMLRRPLISK